MVFLISKLLWLLAAPSNMLFVLMCGAALALLVGYDEIGRGLAVLSVALYFLFAFGPVASWLLRPLEDRFPRPPATSLEAPDGIIVLGGAMNENISAARDALVLGEHGSRMTEAIALARRFPNAKVIFTGGSANLMSHTTTEADAARQLFEELGLTGPRMIYESQSRNTPENAIFTARLLHPRADQHWLLVTSAFHMPRAFSLFHQAGFNVTPWPADYMTSGERADFWSFHRDGSSGLRMVDTAVHEWLGLIYYRLSGRTSSLLPPIAPSVH